MLTLHGNLMKRAVLANCKQNYFVLQDDEALNGSRLVDRNEFAKAMLGFACYIAEHCPQLFTAIPLYLTYVTSPVTPENVNQFLGQSLMVSSTIPSLVEDGVYSRQTITISEHMNLLLTYSYSKPLKGEVYYKGQIQETVNVRSMSELCDTIQRYSGEVVPVEQ